MRDKQKSHEPTVAHAEAAMEAGRDYEDPREGHNKMYDNYTDLERKNDQPIHKSYNAHRGARIDEELAEEDQETIEKQNQKHHHKAHEHHHGAHEHHHGHS